ncbi:MAG: hypothetical protein OXC28_05975 [Defluviicoccus sp.]|nr:hypothetical protein [Defluviicoccus sp.]
MSTTGIENWAVDLKDVGAIYPFQGAEVLFLIVGVVLWLGWHVLQIRAEKREYEEIIREHGDAATIGRALDGE